MDKLFASDGGEKAVQVIGQARLKGSKEPKAPDAISPILGGKEDKLRAQVVQQTTKDWRILRDVFKLHSIGNELTDAKLERIWSRMKANKKAFVLYLQKSKSDLKNAGKIGLDGKYKKTSVQNMAMAEYLKWEVLTRKKG